MADKKRLFWDSKFAEWIESRSFMFAYWVTDKRYPIITEDSAYLNEWSTVTVPDKSPNNVEIVPSEEKPIKKKRSTKKISAKKPPTKKNWNY